MLHNSNGEWLTVKQVSHMTGKSIDAIRMLLHRKKLSNVKKVNSENGGANRAQWLIHKDTAKLLCNSHITSEQPSVNHNVIHDNSITEDTEQLHNIDTIPLHYHDHKQREWLAERDKIQAGLMMYRWKYEELDKQVKLLPAPVEAVSTILQNKEQALQDAREAITRLEEDLRQERKLPWWKKMLKKR